MPYVQDPGDWSQVVEELAVEQHQMETEQYFCQGILCLELFPPKMPCCQGCDRFGVVSGWDEHYGTIYQCNCLPVFWVIDPQTDEKVEFS